MKIVYLHGFGSVGSGPKYDALVAAFGADNVISPDLPNDPNDVESIIDDIVRSIGDFPVMFVGTSLGGFWANYAAQKWDAQCILVNPSLTPSITMASRIGKPITNYQTGAVIDILPKYIDDFKLRELYISDNTNGALINLIVAADDDVIPYKDTLASMPYTASTLIAADGGHRFDSRWGDVIAKAKTLISA